MVLVFFSLCFAVFEQYQKSRMQFVQTVADMASRQQNIEILQKAGERQDQKMKFTCKTKCLIVSSVG